MTSYGTPAAIAASVSGNACFGAIVTAPAIGVAAPCRFAACGAFPVASWGILEGLATLGVFCLAGGKPAARLAALRAFLRRDSAAFFSALRSSGEWVARQEKTNTGGRPRLYFLRA